VQTNEESKAHRPMHLGLLAAVYADSGQTQQALDLLVEALQTVEATSERVFEAELHRLQGAILLNLGRNDEGESSLRRALTISRSQQARLWEVRASTRLARLWHDQGRQAEARDLLDPICSWFSEGFETVDLKEAKALLNKLTE
jgi:predicted ATPase